MDPVFKRDPTERAGIERNLARERPQPLLVRLDHARKTLMVDDRIAVAKIDQRIEAPRQPIDTGCGGRLLERRPPSSQTDLRHQALVVPQFE